MAITVSNCVYHSCKSNRVDFVISTLVYTGIHFLPGMHSSSVTICKGLSMAWGDSCLSATSQVSLVHHSIQKLEFQLYNIYLSLSLCGLGQNTPSLRLASKMGIISHEE